MADAGSLRNDLLQFTLSNLRFTGERIGSGSYGSVEAVEVAGAKCAAKKIHDMFQDRNEVSGEEIRKVERQFVAECQLMSSLRHPHIVQFIGVCFVDGSRMPVLVTERLLTCLHGFLEPEGKPRPYIALRLKCSILRDVASGLSYLHDRSPPIIHRDLSARNVLLNSSMVAKIGDLGVARFLPNYRAATMTKAPGATVYMPPEALEAKVEDRSIYDVTIDIFSLGVLAIFTLSQTFPCNLLSPTYSNRRNVLVPRTELERRENYMIKLYSQLQKGHLLLQMIEQCLKNRPKDRPPVSKVVSILEQARADIPEDESDLSRLELLHTVREKSELIERKDKELHHVRDELEGERKGKGQQFTLIWQANREEIRRLQEQIQSQKQEIAQLRQQVSSMRINGPQYQAQVTPAVMEELHRNLQQRGVETSAPVSTSPARKISSTSARQPRKLKVQCHTQKEAPEAMTRGSAVTDHDYAYFAPGLSDRVYRYPVSADEWQTLPLCPYRDPQLAIIDGHLSAMGGMDEGWNHVPNILTLRQIQWIEELPPNNNLCHKPAIVTTPDGNYTNVIITGGYLGDYRGSTEVKVLNTRSKVWSTLTNMPGPLPHIRATVCRDELCVIGCTGDGYTCSLQTLLHRDQPTQSQSVPPSQVWAPLPSLPVQVSTPATLCGQLVIIGGRQGWPSVKTIHQLVDGQWVEIGSLSSPRNECLAVTPSPNTVVVVGGCCGTHTCLDSVEVCTVV